MPPRPSSRPVKPASSIPASSATNAPIRVLRIVGHVRTAVHLGLEVPGPERIRDRHNRRRRRRDLGAGPKAAAHLDRSCDETVKPTGEPPATPSAPGGEALAPRSADRGPPRRPPPRVGPSSWLMASGMARGASRASCSPAGGQTSRRRRERSGLGCRGRDLEPPLTAAGRTSSTPAAGRRSRPPWRWGWPRCRRSPPTTRLRRLPTVGRRSV